MNLSYLKTNGIGGREMTICRVCKKTIIGSGYVVHHGSYHPECLMKKFPYAEGIPGPHVILYWNCPKEYEELI